MTEQLQISLLGSFQVTRAGEPVFGFKTNKGRALLAYLAVERAPVYDDFLSTLLWPESSDQKARRSLNQEILTIRQILGEALIVRRERTIQLNPQAQIQLDVAEFRHLLALCSHHRHPRAELCPTCALWRAEAVALWRGEFLQGISIKEGEPFDRWLAIQWQQLHLQRMATLAALAQFYEWRGAWELAQQYAQQQLDLEPWREDVHRQLMRIWARAGQQGAAIVQYQRCCTLLKQELGIDPAPETVALFDRIRAPQRPRYTDVPTHLPPLIGRQQELAELCAMLAHPDCRLVTLVGFGGVGKTRLALAVAQQRSTIDLDGVIVVDLGTVNTVDGLVLAMADALHMTLAGGTPLEQLLSNLRSKELFVLLDNFEQLLVQGNASVQLLAQLLDAAPQVKLLVTSRVILDFAPWEWVYDLQGLALPPTDSPDAGGEWSAVQFFVARACQRFRSFTVTGENQEAIVRICRLVEGIPLAIELAAAWVRHLSCPAIADALQQNLDLLATTSPAWPERHRSVRATLEYSWQLLPREERAGLQKLAIFPGSFTAAAAAQIAAMARPILDELVQKQLIKAVANDRYGLHELVHQFAGEKLALLPEQLYQMQTEHCTYYLTWLARQEAALEGAEQGQVLAAIRTEIANLRAAWAWALSQGHYTLLRQAVQSYGIFYRNQGWFAEGKVLFLQLIHKLDQVVDRVGNEAVQRHLQGAALVHLGRFCEMLTQFAEAQVHLRQALAILRQLAPSTDLATALHYLGWLAFRHDQYAEAVQLTEESLAINDALNYRTGVTANHNNLGVINLRQYKLAEARHHFLLSAELAAAPSSKATILMNLGKTAQFAEAYCEAEAYRRQALALFERVENQHSVGVCLANLGHDLVLQGRLGEAEEHFVQSLQLRRAAGDQFGEAESLQMVGMVAFYQGRYEQAESVFQQSLTLAQAVNAQWLIAEVLIHLGNLALIREAHALARQRLEEGLKLFQQLALERFSVAPLALLAELAGQLGQTVEATQLLQQAITISQHLHFREGMALCLQQFGSLAQLANDFATAEQQFEASYEHAMAIGHGLRIAWARYHRAHVALRRGNLDLAAALFGETVEQAMAIGACPIVLACLLGLAEVHLGRTVEQQAEILPLCLLVAHHPACPPQLRHTVQRRFANELPAMAPLRNNGSGTGCTVEEIVTVALSIGVLLNRGKLATLNSQPLYRQSRQALA